jgi:hypothetical protein
MLAHLSSEIVRASPAGRVFAHDFPRGAVNRLKTFIGGPKCNVGTC